MILSSFKLVDTLHLQVYRFRAHLIKVAARLLREFLILLGMRIGKLVDISNENTRVPGLIKTIEVAEPATVTLTDPNLCKFLHLQTAVPHEGCTFSRRAIGTYFLKDVHFHIPTGTVCTSNNAIIMDSLRERNRMKDSAVYGKPFPTPKPLKGTFSSIWGVWPDNYFHWLIENILKLYSLQFATSEPIELLMPRRMSEIQNKILNYCLPENVSVRYVDDCEWLQVETFILAPYLIIDHDFAYIPKPHLDFLRKQVFAKLGLSGDHKYLKNIYISRRKCKARRVLNEPEVIDCLARYDFEPYILEDLSFEEQVRLFHQAKVVVAPHGAGLTNSVFSGNIRLVELIGLHPVPLFFFLAQAMDQDYFYLLSKEGKVINRSLKTPSSGYQKARDTDFTVDIDELSRLMEKLNVS